MKRSVPGREGGARGAGAGARGRGLQGGGARALRAAGGKWDHRGLL